MVKKRKTPRRHRHRLQWITLCISTAMVLVLLGLVVLSVMSARNLSNSFRENLIVTMMLDNDMTATEASQFCNRLKKRPYLKEIEYISKEKALEQGTKSLGTDPTEFTEGENPFPSFIELKMQAEYANNDSLKWISKELKRYPKVTEVSYQTDLVESVNRNIAKVSIVLLVLALLLTFVSFSLINNTVRLGIYSSRFTMHTMKLVGASWGFIRWPFVRKALLIGFLSALLATAVLAACVWGLYNTNPEILSVLTWQVMAATVTTVFLFGIIITGLCSYISVNKFLRMKAGELYKI